MELDYVEKCEITSIEKGNVHWNPSDFSGKIDRNGNIKWKGGPKVWTLGEDTRGQKITFKTEYDGLIARRPDGTILKYS